MVTVKNDTITLTLGDFSNFIFVATPPGKAPVLIVRSRVPGEALECEGGTYSEGLQSLGDLYIECGSNLRDIQKLREQLELFEKVTARYHELPSDRRTEDDLREVFRDFYEDRSMSST
jgi:hypothetical protein